MNSPLEIQLPPHSVEAEQSLIGALILDCRAWDRIADAVTATDFYRDDHRRIFIHIALFSNAGKPFDIVTLFESILRSNEGDQTGGLAYLGEIANNTPSAANIRHYAEIIHEKATLRRLIVAFSSGESACYGPGRKSASDIVEQVEQQLAAEIDQHVDEPASLGDVMTDTLTYIDQRGDTAGLKIGFHDFDILTGGLEGGQLIVVGARPSVGKTLLAGNVADYVSRKTPTLFFTLEMTKREISMRILSARSAVSVHAMRAGTKDNDAWTRMYDASLTAKQAKLWIDDKPAISAGYVRARARRIKRQHGLGLIVIDYLGLMQGFGDNRTQQIGSISRDLKALAKELDVPIILLAQLNRSVEGRTDRRPVLSDLRDSGEVEQDADVVAFLHREALYNDSAEWDNFAELLIRKNRNGPLGDVLLRYSGERMTFSPWQGQSPRERMPDKTAKKAKGFA